MMKYSMFLKKVKLLMRDVYHEREAEAGRDDSTCFIQDRCFDPPGRIHSLGKDGLEPAA